MGGREETRIPRRRFLGALGLVGLADPRLLAGASSGSLPEPAPTGPPGAPPDLPRSRRPGTPPVDAPGFPRHDLDRVQSIVTVAHFDLERVRELVTEQPALAKASWDWGFGDWETPLGAASHTGRREIAEFLIAHGARPTIFSAAMMGDLRTVEAFLTADPALHRLHGPHGISLVRHARAGGDTAAPVLEHLLDRFGPDEIPFGFPGDADVGARYGGRYRFDTDPELHMVVGVRNDWLMFGTGEVPTARLVQVSDDVFHPSGAPAVRFRFEMEGEFARALEITDGPVEVRGAREPA